MTSVIENKYPDAPVIENKTPEPAPTPEPKATSVDDAPPGDKNPLVDKVLREKNNWRAKAQEMEAKLKERETSDLTSQNKFKELYEAQLDENKTLKSSIEEFSTKEVKAAKLGAVKKELQALGLRDDRTEVALRFINPDLEKVKYDPENHLVFGAAELAKGLKETLPDIFGRSNVSVDSTAPQINVDGELTSEKYKSMSLADKRKNMEAAYRASGLAPRS